MSARRLSSRLGGAVAAFVLIASGLLLATSSAGHAAPSKVDLKLKGKSAAAPVATAHGTATPCAACHSTASWQDVRFDHARTGFLLKDAHQRLSCKTCHKRDFKTRIAQDCASCHHDPHALEFGKRCDGCHDEASWRTNFSVDAHRSTNFPLTGRHALVPCSECHPNARDRSFSRAATTCVACHQKDYLATATSTIDHVTAGFSTNCRECHSTIRFIPARYGEHDNCFRITSGAHAGIRCASCHSTVPSVTSPLSCGSGTAACTSCHEHRCDRTDGRHRNVPGYQCKDRKCYECHRFSSK